MFERFISLGLMLASVSSAAKAEWVVGGFRDTGLLAYSPADPRSSTASPAPFPFVIGCGTEGVTIALRVTNRREDERETMTLRSDSRRWRLAGKFAKVEIAGPPEVMFTAPITLDALKGVLSGQKPITVKRGAQVFAFDRAGLSEHATSFLQLCERLKRKGERGEP
jgi:hypothetical protein